MSTSDQCFFNSGGLVKIKSKDHFAKSSLKMNYLSTPVDQKEWVEAIHCAKKILGQSAFDDFSGGEIFPEPSVDSDEKFSNGFEEMKKPLITPLADAMDTGTQSVVDPKSFKIHGME